MKQITDNAIERRRAELRRLQLQNSKKVGTGSAVVGGGGAAAAGTGADIRFVKKQISNSDLINRARNMTAGIKSRHQQRINSTAALSSSASLSSKNAPSTTVGTTTDSNQSAGSGAILNPSTRPSSNTIPNTIVDTTPAAPIPSTTNNRSSPTRRTPAPRGFPTSSVVISAVPSSDVSAYGNDDDSVSAAQGSALSPTSRSSPQVGSPLPLPPTQQQQQRSTSSRQDTLLQMRSAAFTPNPKQPTQTTSAPEALPQRETTILNTSLDTDDSTPISSVVTRMPDQLITTTVPTMTSTTASSTNVKVTSIASTSNTTKQESSQLRLIKDLNRVTEEKQVALVRISSLEAQVANLIKTPSPPVLLNTNNNSAAPKSINSFNKLLQIASTQGNDAALRWAQDQTNNNNSNDDEISITKSINTTNTMNTDHIRRGRQQRFSSPSKNHRSRRLKSPKPTGRCNQAGKGGDPLSDDDIASRAVVIEDNFFDSESARYILRKPYGGDETMDCNLVAPKEPFGAGDVVQWHQSVSSYLTTATVRNEASLEVIAEIKADSSVVRLYDNDSISHGTLCIDPDGTVQGYDWNNTVEDVEEKNGVLGRVMYIDGNGDEGEYWLDSIYEEAVKIREMYCGNVFSAAQALMVSKVEMQKAADETNKGGGDGNVVDPVMNSPLRSNYSLSAPPQETGGEPPVGVVVEPCGMTMSPSKPKTPTVDACVGTDEAVPRPTPLSINEQPSPPTTATKTLPSTKKETEEDSASSSDALSAFLIFFFSTIYSLFFFFAIRLPLKILWWNTICIAMYSSFVVGWLYLADDNGAMALGAGVDYQFYPAKMRGFD